MRVALMHPHGEVDLTAELPPAAEDARADLQLDPILAAMAAGDDFLHAVAAAAVLGGTANDADTIRHRQAVLSDALNRPAAFRTLYQLATRATRDRQRGTRGLLDDWPAAILNHAIETLLVQADHLAELNGLLSRERRGLASPAMTDLARMAAEDLDDAYLSTMRRHLRRLRPEKGLLASAELGWGNQGINFTLRGDQAADHTGWLSRVVGKGDGGQQIRLEERDERGARALAELKDELLRGVADVLASSADNIGDFWLRLRHEVGFYVACLNLADALATRGIPSCLPQLQPAGFGMPAAEGLVDVGLWLAADRRMTGNDFDGRGSAAIVVTGANQGGKSTFLRSLGQAQLMMQAGMQVAAATFRSEPCLGLFTHFTREEDASMRSGRLDDELARLSRIVDSLRPGSMLLLNESLSSTNEREGSQLAHQIVTALTDVGVRVAMVTHLHEFAREYHTRGEALFLRATRNPDGTRSFALVAGPPQASAFGDDLYRQVFPEEAR